ncbi:MAG: DUF1304 domain-containing protein [Bacteroidia bacterium]
MTIIEKILIAVVAIEHLYILWIEMFKWDTMGRKAFSSLPKELFAKTKVFAANQGLYNGFLATGLIWSLLIGTPEWSQHVAVFFLGCVIVAGIYGAFTVQRRIFYVQAVPAIIAMIVVLVVR